MTVETTGRVVVYQGNDVTETFDFPFKVLEEEHLEVIERLAATGEVTDTYTSSDYTVEGIGDAEGGSITLTAGPLADTLEIVIRRTVPYTQELDIVNQGGFFPETIEAQLDLTSMGLQQLDEENDRAIKVIEGDTIGEFPIAAERANMYLAFDSDGDPILSEGTGADDGLRGDLADEGTALIKHDGGPMLDDIIGVIYDERDGEVGAINLQYPVGWAPRYGVFDDGTTNWEGTTVFLTNMLRTALAGHTLYFPYLDTGLYATGWNWMNEYGFDGISIEIAEGVEFAGIWHLISSSSPVFRKAPTAVTPGATTSVTVAGGHGMTVGDVRYVTFTGMDMEALDGLDVLATPTSSTVFTVAADTTGQVWSAAGEFHDSPLRNIRIKGTFVTYDRFGSIWAQNVNIDRIHCKSDAAINTSGNEGRGVHVYGGCHNWEIGEIIVDDLGPQSESPTNHAAIAFDGDTVEPQNIHVSRMWVKDSQASGVILKGFVDVDEIVVEAYGRGIITAAPESVSGTDALGFDADEIAAAVWLVRYGGNIGVIRMGQKNGYASGRAFAKYGLVVEGGFIRWDSASSFVLTRQGGSIGLVQVRDVSAIAVAIGPFGQLGHVNIDKIDLGKIEATNEIVIDSSFQVQTAHVWLVNGLLTCNQIVSSDLNASAAFKGEADADAYATLGTIHVLTHSWRAVWIRCNGSVKNINILNRTGTAAVYSVAVDGVTAGLVNIDSIRAGNAGGATYGFLLFAPAVGSCRNVDVREFAPAVAGVGAVTLGNGGANRVSLRDALIFKSGTNAGNGLVLDGTADSLTELVHVEGFAVGVETATANLRLNAVGCVSVSNDDNTNLTDAECRAPSQAAAGNNSNWSA